MISKERKDVEGNLSSRNSHAVVVLCSSPQISTSNAL